jgi:hypothetical protein
MNKKELLDILSEVKPGIAKQAIIEQSTCFVFKNKKVYTYNDEIAVSMPIDTEIKGAVQAEELHKLLKKIKDKEIQLSITDTELQIEGSKFKSGIKLQTQIHLPIDQINTKGKWRSLPPDFMDALLFCRISVDKNKDYPIFNCVHFHNGIAESTDKYRYTACHLKDKSSFPDRLALPEKTIPILLKYDKINKYIIKDGWVHFKNDNQLQFSCRTLDPENQFPDTSIFITMSENSKIIKLPKNLKEILGRAKIFSDKTPEVTISIQNGMMFISGINKAGWYEEKIRIHYKNKKEIKFYINPEFLAVILTYVDKMEIDTTLSKIKFVGDDFVHSIALMV